MSDEIVPSAEIGGSLKDDIAAAFDKVETAPEPAPEPVKEAAPEEKPAAEETAQEKADRLRDEKGRFAPKAKESEEKPAAEAKPPEEKPAAEAKPPEEKPAAETLKPPQSWKPTTREEWAKVPPAVQEEVIRREREVARVLKESSEARQSFQRIKETAAPFEAMIRAEGGDPMRGYEAYLREAALMRTATPTVKAQAIAGLIKNYLPGKEGVELLDQALTDLISGNPRTQSPQQPVVYRDPRVDQMLEARQAEVQRAAQAAIEEVRSLEFYEDVKLDMADLLEVASRRGLPLTAKDAYNRAVALHPEVSKVVEQRSKAAATQGGATQRARNAASSVRAEPAVGVKPSQSGSLRDDIAAAMSRSLSRE